MGAEGGNADATVTRFRRKAAGAPTRDTSRIWFEPWAFEFFQAVRRLGQLVANRKAIGHFNPPGSEQMRLGIHHSLSFPASDIQGIVQGDQPKLMVNVLALTGPQGPLPLPYTELLLERARARDTTLQDFLDIFHHRLLSLFYRAWEKYRFAIAYEHGEGENLSRWLLDLIGLGTKGLGERLSIPDRSLVYYAGLLSMHPRTAVGLRDLLSDFFEVPVEIDQFVGQWYPLEESAQTCMDVTLEASRLGAGAVVGDEVLYVQGCITVRVGPLRLERYLDFLPGGLDQPRLQELVRFYLGDETDFRVQLVLDREDVPACELGAEGDEAPRLGWLTWIRNAPMNRDPRETVLYPSS